MVSATKAQIMYFSGVLLRSNKTCLRLHGSFFCINGLFLIYIQLYCMYLMYCTVTECMVKVQNTIDRYSCNYAD